MSQLSAESGGFGKPDFGEPPPEDLMTGSTGFGASPGRLVDCWGHIRRWPFETERLRPFFYVYLNFMSPWRRATRIPFGIATCSWMHPAPLAPPNVLGPLGLMPKEAQLWRQRGRHQVGELGWFGIPGIWMDGMRGARWNKYVVSLYHGTRNIWFSYVFNTYSIL